MSTGYYNDNISSLAFVQFATKQMREKVQIYDELEDLQERSGSVDAVILMALGTVALVIFIVLALIADIKRDSKVFLDPSGPTG